MFTFVLTKKKFHPEQRVKTFCFFLERQARLSIACIIQKKAKQKARRSRDLQVSIEQINHTYL